ncbi:hypothetical protein BV898_06364 [Hypsibius exemplaris]|uniref:Protein kinase domain-containing protein n=1 Tax=Hypsibius exemplaris TaxID=2072580 RepID=A0A1W0WWM1_HYPEX|nr:hypothetical protein BV898_06364 [Hypsibius exemplaris]
MAPTTQQSKRRASSVARPVKNPLKKIQEAEAAAAGSSWSKPIDFWILGCVVVDLLFRRNGRRLNWSNLDDSVHQQLWYLSHAIGPLPEVLMEGVDADAQYQFRQYQTVPATLVTALNHLEMRDVSTQLYQSLSGPNCTVLKYPVPPVRRCLLCGTFFYFSVSEYSRSSSHAYDWDVR